jgi:hypothetical protein
MLPQYATRRSETWRRLQLSFLQEAILREALSAPHHRVRLGDVWRKVYGDADVRSVAYNSRVSTISGSAAKLARGGLVRRVDERRYPAIFELTSEGIEMTRRL